MNHDRRATPDRLAELIELYEAGVLSDEELLAATGRVLSQNAPEGATKRRGASGSDLPQVVASPVGTAVEEASAAPVETPTRQKPRRRLTRGTRRVAGVVIGVGLVLLIGSLGSLAFYATRSPAPSSASSSSTQPTEPPPSPSVAPSTTPSPLDFATAVWPQAADQDVAARLFKACGNQAAPRCRSLILRSGGSEEAADFFEQNGLFLTGTYPAGSVDIGFVSGPLGANYVASPLVLSDSAGAISPNDELADMSPSDRAYRKLLKAYPDLMLFQSEVRLETPVVLDDGSTELTYQYPLYDGCHACGQPGSARFTLKFSPEGAFEGSQPAETCGVAALYEGLPVPFCPAATVDLSTPERTLAPTPRQAVIQLIEAWEAGDMEAASEVASAQPVDFLWAQPATTSLEVGKCITRGLAEEFGCSLSGLLYGGAVVAETSDGYYVALVGQGE